MNATPGVTAAQLSRLACLVALIPLTAGCHDGTDSQGSGFVAPLPQRPTRLVFTQQPGTATSMRIIPPVEIAVLDDRGAVVSEPGIRVTIRLHRNNTYGEQGRLYGTKTVMTINGIATFADLSIDKAWAETKNGYTLLARAPSLLDAVSGSFAVLPGSPAALQVVMSAGWNPYQQPVVAGQTFWVWADVVDQGGNYVSGDTRLITIRLSGGPAEATLSGPTSVNAVDGEAFFEVSIDRPGTDYRITATATDLREAVVGPFAVVAAVSGAARR